MFTSRKIERSSGDRVTMKRMIYRRQICFVFIPNEETSLFGRAQARRAVAGRDSEDLTLLLHIVTKVDNIFILLLETQKGGRRRRWERREQEGRLRG